MAAGRRGNIVGILDIMENSDDGRNLTSRMRERKNEEIQRLQRRLETEKAKVQALSQELDATHRMLNTLLGRNDLSQCDLRTVNSALERQAIEAALLDLKGNITAAARKLGMSRQSLYTKIRTYDIELDSKRNC